MYSVGIDLGSSSVKVAIYDALAGACIASAQYPDTEMKIDSPFPSWAEQSPEVWWDGFKKAYAKCLKNQAIDTKKIESIGIAYQMHGLVCLDKSGDVLRPSIIWCDSRAVQHGIEMTNKLDPQYVAQNLLNKPGNFTAAKLAWVKENEPEVFEQIDKICLPGDYIAFKLTRELCTSYTGLSEGIFLDFESNSLSDEIIKINDFPRNIFPPVKLSFDDHGTIDPAIAEELNISKSAKVRYKAGDQPNNAFSLNVLKPGEVAATAGTSGVLYAVTDKPVFDDQNRINSFAHVNHKPSNPHLGILLCINGVGIANSWIKSLLKQSDYITMNDKASRIPPGSDGLMIMPFGNGAERMLNNQNIGSQIIGIDFVRHSENHIFRAVQEGIAFSFMYGMEILKEKGIDLQMMKVGNANLFLSPLFSNIIASLGETQIQVFDTNGAIGAAMAALSADADSTQEIMKNLTKIRDINPDPALTQAYQEHYSNWKNKLENLKQ